MADVITPAERALIDAALAAGKVTVIPRGQSAYAIEPSPVTGRPVVVNRMARARANGALRPWQRRIDAERAQAIGRRRARVRARWEAGESASRIAADSGIALKTVLNDLAAMGLDATRPDPRLAAVEARRGMVLTLALRGAANVTIAAKLGVSEATISQDLAALRRAGLLRDGRR